jgi:6-pyruvoyltetrahydropterin/6-carboxytetrahydropterin synthase
MFNLLKNLFTSTDYVPRQNDKEYPIEIKIYPKYTVTKTYGHDLGLSACFRQWRAKSHCQYLHGYPLSFSFTFESSELDENGWVIDFGSLKPIKEWLVNNFDHKTLVAKDDPYIHIFEMLNNHLSDSNIVDRVGCEAFAKMAYDFVKQWLKDSGFSLRVYLERVDVAEHGSNAVSYSETEIHRVSFGSKK